MLFVALKIESVRFSKDDVAERTADDVVEGTKDDVVEGAKDDVVEEGTADDVVESTLDAIMHAPDIRHTAPMAPSTKDFIIFLLRA